MIGQFASMAGASQTIAVAPKAVNWLHPIWPVAPDRARGDHPAGLGPDEQKRTAPQEFDPLSTSAALH